MRLPAAAGPGQSRQAENSCPDREDPSPEFSGCAHFCGGRPERITHRLPGKAFSRRPARRPPSSRRSAAAMQKATPKPGPGREVALLRRRVARHLARPSSRPSSRPTRRTGARWSGKPASNWTKPDQADRSRETAVGRRTSDAIRPRPPADKPLRRQSPWPSPRGHAGRTSEACRWRFWATRQT